MKFCSLLFMLWVLTLTLNGQPLHPGGVKGAIQWYCTDTSATTPGLRSRLAGNNSFLTFDKATVFPLNFHSSLVVDGRQPLRIDLGTRDLRSASYFTVYQSLDTADENSIWHITNDQQTTLILTTDRMADLSVYHYMNYKDVEREQPKVNIYVQHKEKDSLPIRQQWWNIGARPTTPQVPVISFRGLLPEIIAYDRVLNSRERLQVASYLALKYGITLTEPRATYVNSNGEEVWNGYDYPIWHRNIAGICRDDAAGLNQSIAGSSNSPGLLTIAASDPLRNNSFLLWGDNDKPLVPAPKTAGLPLLLQKTWLIKPYGNDHPFTTDLVLNTKDIDASLPVKPVYWLAIDPTGEGRFASAATEFIRMDQLDKQGNAHFKKITWDKDGSGKDVWGIIAAQELLLATVIDQPSCASVRTGSLQVRILGGQAPFQFMIQSTGGFSINRRMDNATTPVRFTDLGTGKYFLKVTDAAQHIYTDSFYINNEDVPLAAGIDAGYTLPPGRPLQLNAAAGMPDGLAWQWSGPGNFQSFHPQVSITEPGLYTLRCSKNGCSSEQDVLVTATHNNMLYDVTVFPNASTGVYNARITLDKPGAVTMTIYGPDGKLVFVQKGDNRANYLFTGELKTSGVYQLVFTSGLSKTTKTLVIAK